MTYTSYEWTENSVSVTTDDRRTFTYVLGADKDMVHRDQTAGNNNNAMLDCKSGFHQNEEKRNLEPLHAFFIWAR